MRIQRFRLRPGWNLLSLAVTATNLSDQLQGSGVVTAARSWNPQTGNYSLVPQVALPGTVVWVNAATNTTISVVGAYSDPVDRQIAAGATYLASAGLEAWTPTLPPSVAVWFFNPQPSTLNPQSTWLARLTGDLSSIDDLPRTFAPGQALYVINNAPAELEAPDPALRIRYYHQDHLGSSSVMTDANGALVEETAFYPFGIPRHEHRPRQVDEAYEFTQKERDRESGLHYFEARYLAGGLARFIIQDPKYANPDALESDDAKEFLSNPQKMNTYAYARNNPLSYVDPTGLEVEGIVPPPLQDEDESIVTKITQDTATVTMGICDNAFGCGMPNYQFTSEIITKAYNVDKDSTRYQASAVVGFGLSLALPVGDVVGPVGEMVGFGGKAGKAAIGGGGDAALGLADTAVAERVALQPAAPAAKAVSKGAITADMSSAEARVVVNQALQRASDAVSRAQLNNYYEILKPITEANRQMIKAGVHPSTVTDLSLRQADAIWVSRYGTRPPGSF